MPIINPWIFYLIGILNNIREYSLILIFVAILFFVLLFAFYIVEEHRAFNLFKKYIKTMIVFVVLFVVINCIIPSQETMYTMLVSSQVTQENINTIGDTIKDSVDYIFDKINQSEE